MPYYSKMGACPMKSSGITFTFTWNLESLCIHNLAYTIPLVGHGQGLVHSTCLTWDFSNTYHMFFHEAIRVCTALVTNKGNQYTSPTDWILTMNDVTVVFWTFVPPHSIMICSEQAIKTSAPWPLQSLG